MCGDGIASEGLAQAKAPMKGAAGAVENIMLSGLKMEYRMVR